MAYKLVEKDIQALPQLGEINPVEFPNSWKFENLTTGVEEKLWLLAIEYHYLAIVVPLVYIVCIFATQKYMQSRPAYKLQGPLAVWNAALAIFSAMGAVRHIHEFHVNYQLYGVRHTLCNPNLYYGVAGFWSFAFFASKLLEFGDTVFIVLRKQRLIFLHWYHHATVFYMAWNYFVDHSAMGRWFSVMNYSIHTIMYSYYVMRACRISVPRSLSMSITGLQIAQMVVGNLLYGYLFYDRFVADGPYCHNSSYILLTGNVIFISYLLLFVRFFVHAYLSPGSQKACLANGSGSNGHAMNGSHKSNGKFE